MLAEAPHITIPDQIRQKFARLDKALHNSDSEYQNTRDIAVAAYDAWLDSIDLFAPETERARFEQIASEMVHTTTRSVNRYYAIPIPGFLKNRWVLTGMTAVILAGTGIPIIRTFIGGEQPEIVPPSVTPTTESATPIPSPARVQYEKIMFWDPDEFYKQALPASNGNIASLRGQIEATYSDVQGAYIDQETGVDPEKYEELRENDPQFNEKIDAGAEKFYSINPQAPHYPNNSDLLATKNSQGEIVEFNYFTVDEWRDFFNAIGEYTPAPVSESAPSDDDEVSPVEAPAAEPASDRRQGDAPAVGSGFRAGPESYMCRDGLKNVADAIAKAQKDKCIYPQLVDRGIDINKLRGFNGRLSDLFVQYPELRQMFPLNQDLNIYVKDRGVVSTMPFQFSDSKKTNLLTDRVVNISDEVVVLTDGDSYALFLKKCGNYVFGIPQPKVAPAETPITAPAPERPAPAVAPAPAEAPRLTATPRIDIPVGPRSAEVLPTPTPITVEQLPVPIRSFVEQQLRLGQQVVIKLYDANNNGLCDDPISSGVSGVIFEIEHFVPTNGALAPRRFSVFTNYLGVALGEFRPVGEPFQVFEIARPGMRLIPNQSKLFGRAGFDAAIACNGPDVSPLPTQELRYQVCVAIGSFRNVTEIELRNIAASLQINPNLSIPELQNQIAARNCVQPTPTPQPFVTAAALPTATLFNPSPISVPTHEATPTASRVPAAAPTNTLLPIQPPVAASAPATATARTQLPPTAIAPSYVTATPRIR